MSSARFFIITGMLRSGTTLLQQALNACPDMQCSYQDSTGLFTRIKSDFLKTRNLQPYHILSTLFPADPHPEQLTAYLHQQDFIKQLISDHPSGSIQGYKEVLMEEFIPYLLRYLRVILVIRNPKDVISSMHYGNFEQYSGSHRPVLFDIRNWRKSAAFAIYARRHPGFLLLHYEDLVCQFDETISKVLRFLGRPVTDIPDILPARLRHNSSFAQDTEGVFTNSVNQYRYTLDSELEQYIEQLCFPEMQALGYSCHMTLNQWKENRYYYIQEPFPISRPEFKDFDAVSESEKERARHLLLQSNNCSDQDQLRKSYIYPEIFEKLHLSL